VDRAAHLTAAAASHLESSTKKLLTLAALITVVLASGCASVPMASGDQDTAAKSFATKPGKANIYVYRNETMGAAMKMSVALNQHTVTSKTENDSAVTVNALAGRNYFLWQEVKMGLASARSYLQQVEAAKF
jgi:hypothetical protein